MSKYFKMKKSMFLDMFNLKSVYFTMGSPPKDNAPQLLTESLLISSKYEQYFSDEKTRINLSGKDFKISLSNEASKEEEERYGFKIYKDKEKLIEHCNNKLSKKEYNENTISLVKDMKEFLDDGNKSNYSKVFKKNSYLIPDIIYIKNPILNNADDFDKIKDIEEIYVVSDLLKGEYKVLELDSDSIYYVYNIFFYENEVVAEINIKLNYFGDEIELNEAKKTDDGFILKTDEKLFTNKKDMHRAIKRTLDMAQKNWDKSLNLISSVDY